MNQQTARYVIFHYTHFMNAKERSAWTHLIATGKADAYRKLSLPEEFRREMVQHFSEGCSTDPDVLQLVSDGGDAFFENTATRILHDHEVEIYLNRCPQCGEVTVTPRSKQCRYCKHDWHD